MLTVRTYYVALKGDVQAGVVGGIVKRLDNLTGSWNDVSLPTHGLPGALVSLYDVKTDPNDGDRVIAVGEAKFSSGYYGIYVSNNGGATWQIPGGNYQSIFSVLGTDHWWRISVVDSNTIYVSGTNGHVCKSTNGGATFTLCTILPSLPTSYGGSPSVQDGYSVHFITPLAGVVGMDNNVVMTSDGGITWNPCCGGNGIELSSPGLPNPGQIFGIHLDVTSQKVVANGQYYAMRSTNAGVTWSTVYTWTAGNGYHLTYEDDLRLWITNLACGQRARSIDGGITWTLLSPCSVGSPVNPAMHFYLNDNGFVSANKNMMSTTDGGITGLLSDTCLTIISAVYTNYLNQNCYLLTPCDPNSGAPSILVDNDLSQALGQVIKVCPGDLPPGLPPGVVGTPVQTIPCSDSRYTLVDCCGIKPTIFVNNDMAPYTGGVIVAPSLGATCWKVAKYTGGTSMGCVNFTGATFYRTCADCATVTPCIPIPTLPNCACFTITQSQSCTGAITLTNIGPISQTCEICESNCFRLVNCSNPNEVIITDVNLAQYLGQIVVLKECPDKCWQVETSQTCDGHVCISEIIKTFPDCASCLPPVPPPAPLHLHARRIKPGYYTPGCDPEYTENTSCTFANAVYDRMVIDRYGVTMCCNEDVDRWDIKKQLLDLKALYDPSLCKSSINKCCKPCDVQAMIIVADPLPCLPPVITNVTIQIPGPCLAPREGSVKATIVVCKNCQ